MAGRWQTPAVDVPTHTPPRSPSRPRRRRRLGPKRSSSSLGSSDGDSSNWFVSFHVATADGRTYQLEIVQQPVRARACGFGDKDRRPLSPPPIIRLWIRNSSGDLINISDVDIHFLILTVDLWSANGDQQRNVVQHPTSIQTSRLESPLRPAQPFNDLGSNRPVSSGRPWSGYRLGGMNPPSSASPNVSPLTNIQASFAPALPVTVTGWRGRPSTEPSRLSFFRTPQLRPATAPSPSHITLPPLSSITEHSSQGLTLPAMQERPLSAVGSQSRSSWSTESSRPPTDYSFHDSRNSSASSISLQRAFSSRNFGIDRRPSTGDSNHAESSKSAIARFAHPLPPAPIDFGTTNVAQPTPSFSRVLVGSLQASCQRLLDENGNLGLFFFAHDLGVRTEGVFTLKFSLADLSSLMASATKGQATRILASCFSTPFTVYSAKRFPGVLPTTALTQVFASQNVRLPTRQKRARDNSPAMSVDSDG